MNLISPLASVALASLALVALSDGLQPPDAEFVAPAPVAAAPSPAPAVVDLTPLGAIAPSAPAPAPFLRPVSRRRRRS